MRITIDTQQDSHENIKKVIKMLQNIVGEGALSNSPEIIDNPSETSDSSPEPSSSPLMNIFGDDEPSQETSTEKDSEVPTNILDTPGETVPETTPEPTTETPPTNAFVNIFGDDEPSQETSTETTKTQEESEPETTTEETTEEPEKVEEKEDKFSGKMMEFY
tara:strand:+ start:2711 stop:3196 length:486 start_codon:yes stop_codon:yes gene_type:complete